jgi:nucleoid-associated protein YgaU
MRNLKFLVVWLIFSFFISGCVVRTYRVTKDRVDQELKGNLGYLKGSPKETPSIQKTKRTIQQVEIELYPPIRFKKMITQEKDLSSQDKELEGNLGYIVRKSSPLENKEIPKVTTIEKYTVQNGDTLQKISEKFYGTRRLWMKIYEANKDKLSDPNKIYPGQIIDIPLEREKSNLK